MIASHIQSGGNYIGVIWLLVWLEFSVCGLGRNTSALRTPWQMHLMYSDQLLKVLDGCSKLHSVCIKTMWVLLIQGYQTSNKMGILWALWSEIFYQYIPFYWSFHPKCLFILLLSLVWAYFSGQSSAKHWSLCSLSLFLFQIYLRFEIKLFIMENTVYTFVILNLYTLIKGNLGE